MSLTVELITSLKDLTPQDIQRWNELAANPFQRWEWLGSWWDAYASDHSLYILSVKKDGQTVGFAPWYIENRISTGRTIQFLGSGKACTDHLSLLVGGTDAQPIADAVAQWLFDATTMNTHELPRRFVWDAIELIGIDASDQPINCLVESMRALGLSVQQSDGLGCYVINVPDQWEDYVKMRSKSGRREVRQSLKNIDDGTIIVNTVGSESDLYQIWNHFVNLHQRRRHASGTTGCFDHPSFSQFLRKAASELLGAGMLELVVATMDNAPVAAQFALVDDDSWYFYQSGMEPDASDTRPGLSVFCHAIRKTIESGRKRFDMMRGDEPYKLRWRAELQPAQEVRVCSPKTTARLRKQVYGAGVTFKNLIKSGMGIGHQHS